MTETTIDGIINLLREISFISEFMTASEAVTTVYDMYNREHYFSAGVNAGILTSQIGFLCFSEYLDQQ
jgi:hypothetical protein